MPPSASRRRRAVDSDDGDDKGNVQFQISQLGAGPAKRRRITRDGRRAVEDDDEDMDQDEVVNNSGRDGNNDDESDSSGGSEDGGPVTSRRPNGSRHPPGSSSLARSAADGGFQSGAIVRVTVENFVTYSRAEFSPGPNLNMVIGPNGTGKSTLVCAICLGLGYSPKHLGRASSVREFVKHGCDVATIEIELQRLPRDSSNYVVRVKISKDQNSSRWWLNGRDAALKDVHALMSKLCIQVDNLCQFLPQDRVVEFAMCTPVDLLHETLRAAAPPRMLEWQDSLKGLHRERKTAAQQKGASEDQLRGHEARQQGSQADVERLREREEIQRKVEDLRNARPYAEYTQLRDARAVARAAKKTAEDQLRKLERQAGPALRTLGDLESQLAVVGDVVQARELAVRAAEQEADRMLEAVNAASDGILNITAETKAAEAGFESGRKEGHKIRGRIARLQAKMRATPPPFDGAEWNQKINAKKHEQLEVRREREAEENNLHNIKVKGRQSKDQQDKLRQEIHRLDSREGQMLNWLKRDHKHIVQGVEWLRENQSLFEKEVFGPAMICCSIKDDRYSDLVQASLRRDDFLCFTAQTDADFDRLSRKFYDDLNLNVAVRTCLASRDRFRPPLDAAAAREHGFDGFAVDYLDGPEPVLAMLCAESKIHATGIALNDTSPEQYQRIFDGEKIHSWVAGRQSYRIARRRELGPNAVSTTTRQVFPGRYWKDRPIDQTEKTRLAAALARVDEEFEELRRQNGEIKDELERLQQREQDITEDINNLKSNKNELQKTRFEFDSLPEQLELEEDALKQLVKSIEDGRRKALQRRQERDEMVLEKARLFVKYKDQIGNIMDTRDALLEARIRHLEVQSEVDGLKKRNEVITRRLDELRKTAKEAGKEADELKKRALAKLEEFRDNDEQAHARYTALSEGKTAEELDDERKAEEAKLELVHAVNPQVLREYETRAREIDRLRRLVEGATDTLARLDGEIESIRSQWEPELDTLVTRISDAFSYNFEQINCAGEVRVHRDADDFDKWAIEIMVKFREGEALQRLDPHRQSGGERAVSTIFYLMALQATARAPFRVVDEINQGMDPRNERTVHDRMVEIACHEQSSQYFLVTPKLLTGLRYHEKMRIHCIFSGEFVPAGPDGGAARLDLRRCLEAHKRAVAAGGG